MREYDALHSALISGANAACSFFSFRDFSASAAGPINDETAGFTAARRNENSYRSPDFIGSFRSLQISRRPDGVLLRRRTSGEKTESLAARSFARRL